MSPECPVALSQCLAAFISPVGLAGPFSVQGTIHSDPCPPNSVLGHLTPVGNNFCDTTLWERLATLSRQIRPHVASFYPVHLLLLHPLVGDRTVGEDAAALDLGNMDLECTLS